MTDCLFNDDQECFLWGRHYIFKQWPVVWLKLTLQRITSDTVHLHSSCWKSSYVSSEGFFFNTKHSFIKPTVHHQWFNCKTDKNEYVLVNIRFSRTIKSSFCVHQCNQTKEKVSQSSFLVHGNDHPLGVSNLWNKHSNLYLLFPKIHHHK